jgi:hypothetical protein
VTAESTFPIAATPATVSRLHPHLGFASVAFFAGLGINLHVARMGFMPLDASIVFDGGWRILSGQIPWRDFMTPFGVVPSAMQAVFFAMFGTNWFAYCLHSSVVNGLFGVLVYTLLVVLDLPRILALFYALCACVFFYPPVGVPFMEQHSFFFTLAALTAGVGGNFTHRPRLQWWLWAAVPPLAALAFFSKQVPFVFAAPMLAVVLVLPAEARLRTRLTALLVATLTMLLAGVVTALALAIRWAPFAEFTFERPRAVGGMRTSLYELSARVAARYDDLPEVMGLDFISSTILLYQLAVVALAVLAFMAVFRPLPGGRSRANLSRAACALLLAPLAYISSLLLGFVANNQTQNSVAFYPLGAALLHAGVCADVRLAAARSAQGRSTRGPLLAIGLISLVPVWHWTWDSLTWMDRVVRPRMVNDMTFDPALAGRSAGSLPQGMEFIRWTPSPPTYDLAGWTDLTNFLRARDRNFLIIGDTLVTYGLLGRPSVAPNLWFHPGLTLPDMSDPALMAYEQELLDRIRRHDVSIIVIEADVTRVGFEVARLQTLTAWLTAGWRHTHTFGSNRVYERVAP